MTTIEFLGGEETGNVGRLKWGNYVFELNKPIECKDKNIIAKASINRFFKVRGDETAPAPVVVAMLAPEITMEPALAAPKPTPRPRETWRNAQNSTPRSEASQQRMDDILALHNSGKTNKEVAEHFGVTAERVRQLLIKAEREAAKAKAVKDDTA